MKSPFLVAHSIDGPIIINLNDKFIGRNIVNKGSWADDEIDIITKLLNHRLKIKNNLVFLDVGANIGTHSLAISRRFQNKIKIHAFEAQRQIYYMLCGTIALNNLKQVYCHHAAVHDINGTVISFSPPNYECLNNFGGLEIESPKITDNQNMILQNSNEYVKTMTIDSLNEDVDFIKIDIEGMENKAIRGSINTIKTSRPFILFEAIKTDLNECISLLKTNNYILFRKGGEVLAIPDESGIKIQGLEIM